MSYAEMIKKALNGRSVNAAAKQWGIPQKTLDTYTKGKRLPGYSIAKLLAREAGIEDGEALRILAEEEGKLHAKLEKVSESFNALLRAANACWIRVQQVA